MWLVNGWGFNLRGCDAIYSRTCPPQWLRNTYLQRDLNYIYEPTLCMKQLYPEHMRISLIFHPISHKNANHKPINWSHNLLIRHDSPMKSTEDKHLFECDIFRNERQMYAQAHADMRVYKYVCTYTYMHIESVLIICDSVFVNLPTLWSLFVISKSIPAVPLMVIRSYVNSGEKAEPRSQLRSNKGLSGFLFQSSYCIQVSCSWLIECHVFHIFIFFAGDFTIKNAPKFSANVLPSDSNCKKAMTCLLTHRKIDTLDTLCLEMSYSAVGCELLLMSQQLMLHKVSLYRNISKTRLYIDQPMKCDRRFTGT